ncbi:MAG: hypothetical protein Q9207_005948 [Kuettlingeria erythrocarpa]
MDFMNGCIWTGPNQYTWLLQQGPTSWEDHDKWSLSEENIHDKSNADGTTKSVALSQVLWFVAQTITYLFRWIKPKDILTPSVVKLPTRSEEQRATFEPMAVSYAFDDERIGNQGLLWSVWSLTTRVFEKEAEERSLQEAHQLMQESEVFTAPRLKKATVVNEATSTDYTAKQTVVAQWDPKVYYFKILWPINCLFGASFGALHLICWNTQFPTYVELWLWRASGIALIFSMLVFMQFKKVGLRWGDLLTLISLASPIIYLLSRVVMMGGVIAAFRASDPKIYDTYVVTRYWVHIV